MTAEELRRDIAALEERAATQTQEYKLDIHGDMLLTAVKFLGEIAAQLAELNEQPGVNYS